MLKISITLPNNAQIDLETADAALIDKILDVVLLDITRNLTGPPAALTAASPPPATPAVETPAPATPAAETPAPTAAAHPLAPAVETPPPAAAPAPPVASIPETPPSATPPAAETPAPAAAPVRSWETAAPETATPEKEPIPSPWPTVSPDNAATAADPDTELDPDDDDDWPDYADPDLDAEPAASAPTAALIANGATAPRPGMFAPSEQAFIDFCRDANPLGDMRRVVVAAEGASRYLGMSGVDAQGLGHLFNLAGWPQAHNFTQTLRNSARSKFRWLERVPGRAGYYAVTDLGRKTALGD